MNALIITLSNLGDLVLSLPAIDSFVAKYKDLDLKVICSNKTFEFLKSCKNITELIVFNKRANLREKLDLIKYLRKFYFDFIIDFKNSGLPLFLKKKVSTPLFLNLPKNIHRKERHLLVLKKTIGDFEEKRRVLKFGIPPERKEYLDSLLNISNPKEKVIFLGIGARSHLKRYTPEGFSFLIKKIKEKGFISVSVGDSFDREFSEFIKERFNLSFIDLCAKTKPQDLIYLFEKYAKAVISCDSFIMHLSSYLNIPTLGIFGPTSEKKYGPWSEKSRAVFKENLKCRPCQKAVCKFCHECMRLLEPQKVWEKFLEILD